MESIVMPREVYEAIKRLMKDEEIIEATVSIMNGINEDGRLIKKWVKENANGDMHVIFPKMVELLNPQEVVVLVEGEGA